MIAPPDFTAQRDAAIQAAINSMLTARTITPRENHSAGLYLATDYTGHRVLIDPERVGRDGEAAATLARPVLVCRDIRRGENNERLHVITYIGIMQRAGRPVLTLCRVISGMVTHYTTGTSQDPAPDRIILDIDGVPIYTAPSGQKNKT